MRLFAKNVAVVSVIHTSHLSSVFLAEADVSDGSVQLPNRFWPNFREIHFHEIFFREIDFMKKMDDDEHSKLST